MSDTADLIETWNINNRINLYLLDAIPDDALDGKPTGMRGRSVRELFIHIHNVRLMWLQPMDAERSKTLDKIAARTKSEREAITKSILNSALEKSATAMGEAIQTRIESGKLGILKPTPTAFIAYLISHESYHRGEICMTLTQAGHKLDDEIMYGMWVWDKR